MLYSKIVLFYFSQQPWSSCRRTDTRFGRRRDGEVSAYHKLTGTGIRGIRNTAAVNGNCRTLVPVWSRQFNFEFQQEKFTKWKINAPKPFYIEFYLPDTHTFYIILKNQNMWRFVEIGKLFAWHTRKAIHHEWQTVHYLVSPMDDIKCLKFLYMHVRISYYGQRST